MYGQKYYGLSIGRAVYSGMLPVSVKRSDQACNIFEDYNCIIRTGIAITVDIRVPNTLIADFCCYIFSTEPCAQNCIGNIHGEIAVCVTLDFADRLFC